MMFTPCLVSCLSGRFASRTHPLVSLCFSEPLCVSFASFHTHELHFWKKCSCLLALKVPRGSRWAFESPVTLTGWCDEWRYSWWAGGAGVPQHRVRNKPTPVNVAVSRGNSENNESSSTEGETACLEEWGDEETSRQWQVEEQWVFDFLQGRAHTPKLDFNYFVFSHSLFELLCTPVSQFKPTKLSHFLRD